MVSVARLFRSETSNEILWILIIEADHSQLFQWVCLVLFTFGVVYHQLALHKLVPLVYIVVLRC